MNDVTTRAGTVALVGLPNAGKSSLLNRLLGSKLSIVTPLAQTTRERVVGIDTRDGVQMIFLDTPGIVDPAYLLHRSMVQTVLDTLRDADAVVYVLDPTRPAPQFDPEILQQLTARPARLIVAVNKVDVAADIQQNAAVRWVADALTPGVDVMPVSAETGVGIEELRAQIATRLPPSPYLYPEDELSSQSLRFFTAELVRETIFEQYGEEVPYSSAIGIEEFRESEEPIFIRATIYVERDSQKAIVVGKQGRAIRELGIASRRKIEDFLEASVYLDLWVKVLPKWRKNVVDLKRLGFTIPKELV